MSERESKKEKGEGARGKETEQRKGKRESERGSTREKRDRESASERAREIVCVCVRGGRQIKIKYIACS